ncbi:MAG TPA: hypothetical protein VJM12_05100 [Pyrinomonadaceae bacterium]|nr:hypothetical protein [Pyrinomonadaceae bacterium]
MKNKCGCRIFAACLLVLLWQLAIAQSSTDLSSTAVQSTTKHISSIRTENLPNGSRVIITTDGALVDYGAYRNGDIFQILIPGAELALSDINVKGAGFSDSKIQARGTNLAISFRLDPGASPSVSQSSNRLEVTFTIGNAGNAGEGSSGNGVEAGSSPTAVNANGSESPSTAVAEIPSPRITPSATAVSPSRLASASPQGLTNTGDNITQRDIDLAVPESPAFTVLGVTPDTVVHPTTAREFATSFLNGVDQQGNFQTGLALDFVPYLTFFGDQTSLFSYRRSRMERLLARTQVSFATTKGGSDEDEAARLALGVRLTLWDRGDPRLDPILDECYAGAVNDPSVVALRRQPGETPEQTTLRETKRRAALATAVKPCNDDARKRNWNASGWIVGLAPSWISETGKTSDFRWNGGGFWTSIAYGFENISGLRDNSQFIFHARYRNNEIVADTANAGKFFSQDSLFFGGRLRVSPGLAAKSILSLEGTFIRSRRNKSDYDNASRFSFGFERRINDNIWFSLSMGGESGRANSSNQGFILSSFKWGFSQRRPN